MLGLEELKAAIGDRVFITASKAQIAKREGWQPDPKWIFDFRAVMLEAKWLDAFTEMFWERYASRYPFQVGGLETAGIPLVAAIVMKGVARGTPVNGFYVRKSRKRDGLMKFIEGTVTDDPIVLIDDVINSGQTFERQLGVLKQIGKDASGILTILAYRAPEAYQSFVDRGIQVENLFRLSDFGMPLLKSDKPALPRQSLEQVWKFEASEPSFNYVLQKSAPITDGERVYFGSDRGIFYALNISNGSVAWQFEVGAHPPGKGIFSTPALHGGTVFFGAYDGSLYALDAKTGAKKWVYDEADWIGSSPSVAPDLNLVFIGLEFGLWKKRGGIAAVQMDTGERVWVDRTPELTHGSPLYIREEGIVVIGSNDGIEYAYAARSGKNIWRAQAGASIRSRAAYDPKRRLVIFGSEDGRLYGLSALSGEPLVGLLTNGGFYSTPLVHEDVVYAASLDKALYCMDLETGRERWKFNTWGRIFASPMLADGSLWIGSNDGCLYELDPERGTLRGIFRTTERIVNAICYDEPSKRFFVPTVANELYAAQRVTTQPSAMA